MACAALIIMVTGMFALTGASAQDDIDAVTDPVPALDAAPELPEPEPEPSPTPTPTPPPAPEPTPTLPLEPILVPTVEPTATTMPEPTATMMPTGEPTSTLDAPTSTPEPTVSPTPTPTKGLRSISVQSVIQGALCTLNGPDIVGFDHGYFNYAVFDCKAPKDTGKVTLSTSDPTLRWRYQIIESRTEPNVWKTTRFKKDLTNLGVYQIYLGPVDDTVQGCGQVTVTVTAPNGTTGSATLEACTPDTGPVQCADIAGTPVTASLVNGVLAPIPFSFAPRTVTGTLTIAVDNPQQCQGWFMDVSATDLAYTGSAPGQSALPASHLRVVLPDGASHALDTVQRLVSGGSTDLSASVPLTLELDIPGGSAAGTYTTIVTLSTTAAPGS